MSLTTKVIDHEGGKLFRVVMGDKSAPCTNWMTAEGMIMVRDAILERFASDYAVEAYARGWKAGVEDANTNRQGAHDDRVDAGS